jgi:hypothetical protein
MLVDNKGGFHGCYHHITARGCKEAMAAQFRYLTLIPKKEALTAKDFRPISLVHSFAKLVTKIMANRLAPFIDCLVAVRVLLFGVVAYTTTIS